MAQEAELRIKHDSVEKTTSAIDALISKLDQLDKGLDKLSTENKAQEGSQTKLNTALKAAEIARKKAVDMLGLHQQGLHKLSDAYATEQAAIKAREVAAKKGIETGSKEYETLLNNIKATELATTASKRLAAEQAQKAAEMAKSQKAAELEALAQGKQTAAEKAQEKALSSSNIARETATKLLKLEEKGLDRLSEEYAEARGEILGIEKAKQKGLKTGSDEYNQLVKNTKAIEQSTTARKRLQKETTESTKGASKFTNGLDDMAKQAALVDGPLGGIASRLTTLSTILKSTGGLAGAVALTGIGVGAAVLFQQLSRGLTTAAATEVSLKTLEAQIEQTGGAAGFTADQLDNMARSIAMSTLNSVEGVRGSIASLLSFTNVSGQVFEEAVSKAEDIAILRKSGTSEVIKKLGKVLDNPIARYKELVEWGVEFDDTQVKAIAKAKSLGDIYGQQRIILDAVSNRFKDVAISQADTLSGDIDTFSQKWDTFFEVISRKGIPAMRSLTQAGTSTIDTLTELAETNIETDTRKFKENLINLRKEAGSFDEVLNIVAQDFQKIIESAPKRDLLDQVSVSALSVKEDVKKLYAFISGNDFTPDTDIRGPIEQATRAYHEFVEVILEAKAAEEGVGGAVQSRTNEQKIYLKGLEEELDNQKALTQVFLENGDTQSKEYRQAKARTDALIEAKKKGLEFDKDAVDQIIRANEQTAELTSKRVVHNAVLQKTKSLQAQQAGLERELDLYRATTEGVLKNSDAYITLSASIKTANEVRAISGEVTSDQVKALYQENVELLKAQRNQAVLNALKASDANSANVATLERQIELQRLLSTGVSKSSSEYIYQEERLKALNTIKVNSIAIDSQEYTQLLKNAEAIAAKRSELQKYQDLAEAGITFTATGGAQIEGTLSQLTSALPDELIKLDNLVDVENGISQEMVDKLKENLKATFMDEKNEILIPLGFFVDEEGAIQAATELNLLQEELRVQEKELKALWREEDLITEEQYLERKRQLNVDYEDKITNAKIAAWEATAEAQALSRQEDVAGVISGGAKMISAVAGNSKKLAKISKAAAIFETSTALVQSIAKASAVGWPANIPLIAEAFATGTQLVGQAKSLKEPSFAFGGVDIQGAGTGRSDSIKANIARGESVMTAPATARYKDTLERMNAGLPVRQGGGGTFTSSPVINIQGDASERTVSLIEMRLRDYEERVQQIAQGVSQQTIQEENEVGGFLNPI